MVLASRLFFCSGSVIKKIIVLLHAYGSCLANRTPFSCTTHKHGSSYKRRLTFRQSFFKPSNIVLNPLEVDAKGVIYPHYFSNNVNCSFEGKGKKIWKIETLVHYITMLA